MAADEELDRAEQETVDLVARLMATGNLQPLMECLRDGPRGPENARDALRTLGELDLDLLVQLALDSLIDQYVDDPGLAHQPRREHRGVGGATEAPTPRSRRSVD
jgi:hypothetical protein